MGSGGGILNPLNDISNVLEGTKNLFINPGKQIHKYIEPAAIEALPAAIAVAGTIASGGLLAPAALPFLVGGATTYGAQLATEGAGKMFSGTTPSIGDFGAGLAAGGLTFGAQAALGALSAPSSLASTAASSAPNYLTMSASQLAAQTTGTAAAGSSSLFGTIGSDLGTGFSAITGALGTAGHVLEVSGLAMSAYSMIKGKNTSGQCNSVQSLASQFQSNAQSFDNTYQAIVASNAQQSLTTMQSLYSQETSLANQISSSGSSCVSSTVITQLQQALSSMQTNIQQVQTYLGQATSSTTATGTPASSSACATAQQNFTSLTSQFTNTYSSVTTATASGALSTLQSYYSEAVNKGNQIVSACGNDSTLTSTIQSYLNAMATDIQNLQSSINSIASSSTLSSPISDLTSGTIFNPTSAYAGTLPATSAAGASNTIAANSATNTSTWQSVALIGGAVAAVGFITWELTKGVAK
ncbi:MAG: hypothetical protein ACYC97_02120 [Metallibacterium sp.]